MASLGLILGVLSCAAQGRLREFEEPVRSRRDSEPADTRRQQDQDLRQEDRSGEPLYRPLERPASGDEVDMVDVLFYPFLDHGVRFDDYPYAHGRDRGFILAAAQSDRYWSLDVQTYAVWVGRDLFGVGFTGTARFASGGDFRFDLVQYQENVGGRTDRLTLQTHEVNYGPGRGPRDFQWTLGWGLAILEGIDSHTGASLQGALEWFPIPPLSLRLHGAWLIFSSSTMADLQAEAGLHWNRFSLGLGIRSLINSRGDRLTGPLASLSVWF